MNRTYTTNISNASNFTMGNPYFNKTAANVPYPEYSKGNNIYSNRNV